MKGSEADTPWRAVVEIAAHAPHRPCLTEGTVDWSYREFADAVRAQAAAIGEAGVERGQRVALVLAGYRDCFVALFACWATGAVPVPLDPRLNDLRLAQLVARSDAALVLFDDPSRAVGTVARHAPDQGTSAVSPGAATVPDELGLIMFTSGTTGEPKGVCQRLAAVWDNACLTARACRLEPDDRILINTPPCFTSALIHFLTLVAAGGSLVGSAGFRFGGGLLEEIAATDCSGFGGAPAHVVRVVGDRCSEAPPRLRFWVSSGDRLAPEVAEAFTQRFPRVELFAIYGLTEVSGRLCILDPGDAPGRRGSVGRPIGDMAVCARDAQGRPLAAGGIGELYVTGSLVMQGYLDDEAATRAALTEYGLRTGDHGMVDADGFVWHHGRQDDVFKRGGEKVALAQITDVLLGLEGVLDAAALGLPDDLAGTVPVAVVVLAPGRTRHELRRQLKAALPPVAVPARVVTTDRIPRTGSGKPQRAALRRLFGGGDG